MACKICGMKKGAYKSVSVKCKIRTKLMHPIENENKIKLR
jgi:hypothetical protein